MAKGTVEIDTARCKGCELCVVACPTGVLALGKVVNAKGYYFAKMVKPGDCIGCAGCGYVCPDACITVYKQK
ncbi:MAG: 4Fe-4S dicluster domain-containing protein [Candidatus Symbiothrix sp.]|jgi:2-oxoglutarate ferredoxin oxidoreductase subunit delta|nr:4Fe-4S dicluster domain-containing protein [Candidatus Symbiothrix sp.]